MTTHRLHAIRQRPSRQRGVFSLFITVVIVVAIALLTYTMTNTTVVENRMTSGEIRSKQAFHAAQAGLDFALQHFIDGDLAALNATCEEEPVDADDLDNTATFQLSFGAVDPQCPYQPLGLQTAVVVRSVGRVGETGEIRILEATIDLLREWNTEEVMPTSPDPAPISPSPIVARGNVNVGGNGNAAPCITREQCEALARPGNQSQDIRNINDTLIIAGGNISGGQTGNPDARIQDKHKDANNATISGMSADQFFEHIMGVSKTDFQVGAQNVASGQNLPNVNLNPAVWYSGDLTIQGDVLGSPDKPITLVVDGNLRLVGNAIIWGVVYTTGNDFSAGNSKIFGSLIAENNVTVLTGTSSVFHNSELATVNSGIGGSSGETSTTVGSVQAYYDTGSWREIPAGSAL